MPSTCTEGYTYSYMSNVRRRSATVSASNSLEELWRNLEELEPYINPDIGKVEVETYNSLELSGSIAYCKYILVKKSRAILKTTRGNIVLEEL